MEKEKKRRSVTAALMWRITALALALWLCMMCGITGACAWDIYHQYEDEFNEDVDAISGRVASLSDRESIKYAVIHSSISLNRYNDFPFVDGPLFMDLEAEVEQYEYAIICFDECDQDGNGTTPCLVEDGNVMFFYYYTDDTYGDIKYPAYIDLDETQFGRDLAEEAPKLGYYFNGYYDLYASFHLLDDFRFDRLTGWFEGERFHLVEVADHPSDVSPLEEPEDEWITVVDTAEPGQELVHIYPEDIRIKRAATKPVTVDGVTYDDLGDMLENSVYCYEDQASIFNAVFSAQRSFTVSTGEQYLIRMAVQVSPLQMAFIGLLKFHAVTLLILAVVLLLIYRGIRKKLVTPMRRLQEYVAEGSLHMPEPEECWWKEPYEVYVQPRNAIHELKKEVKQLNTALDYAHDAEENRKRMISNITHELKTPLAVIHSYAEGLKEGIAADKQDHYLEVILEEAERMDGMVLEMLDLSRLEAGKVRLASDRFSLLELTRSVFGKLEPLVTEKSLEVEYLWPEDFLITADEGRMAQVITNLATNAIKYSPEGGKIQIHIGQMKGRTRFAIGNQCDPLPEEALERVWDSFYRADASRTEKGTGLGLAITKTIVELHGGTCKAYNTGTGVEFQFELP